MARKCSSSSSTRGGVERELAPAADADSVTSPASRRSLTWFDAVGWAIPNWRANSVTVLGPLTRWSTMPRRVGSARVLSRRARDCGPGPALGVRGLGAHAHDHEAG